MADQSVQSTTSRFHGPNPAGTPRTPVVQRYATAGRNRRNLFDAALNIAFVLLPFLSTDGQVPPRSRAAHTMSTTRLAPLSLSKNTFLQRSRAP
jgi:hypothetical protein